MQALTIMVVGPSMLAYSRPLDMQDHNEPPIESSPTHSTESAPVRESFYLHLIGLSTVSHSQLDYAIRLLISRLASIKSSTGETLMQRQSTTQLLGTLKRVTPKTSPLREGILDFSKRVKAANQRRNDVVHALWAFDHLGRGSRLHKVHAIMPTADLEQLPHDELRELKELNREFERLTENAFELCDGVNEP
jgi:hypothetical protein